jgi:hypothetical protein
MANVSSYLSKQTLDWMTGAAAATQPAARWRYVAARGGDREHARTGGVRREKFAVARVCKPELISTATLVCRNPNLRSEASLDRLGLASASKVPAMSAGATYGCVVVTLAVKAVNDSVEIYVAVEIPLRVAMVDDKTSPRHLIHVGVTHSRGLDGRYLSLVFLDLSREREARASRRDHGDRKNRFLHGEYPS